jgi:aminopeptidase N
MTANKEYLFNPERNPLFRDDYRPAEYKIDTVDLHVNLDTEKTLVTSKIAVRRNPLLPDVGGALILDGEDLKLKSLRIKTDGEFKTLDRQDYFVTEKNLILKNPPAGNFELEIVTEINPSTNTKLSGIYSAGDLICSQCEAQGFRRISYYLDRPDNLAVFTTTVEADKKEFPILLSNGNGDYTQSQDVGNGRHAVTWSDPHPKPSYLFAVVAGDMKLLEDSFITMSGKEVKLRIFVQEGYEDKIAWAMESIKRAMKWDEEKYGREYDLDMFHVVAVDKFNAGAMENKGLNVFNVSLLVGNKETSTDAELINIERVLGHEYFHNWTGDRVTVRDWFELTLKEGLTVLRDRQFTGDMHSQGLKTIDDAVGLRSTQFLEDGGPSSHPIRPDIVEEFDNIYTGTIYQKGSHVLGMMRTIVGAEVWRAGMDAYFVKFDGQAVTCDDFIDNMQEVSGVDLSQFRRWYSQSGTPEISFEGKYDAEAKTYSLTLTQITPATANQTQEEKHSLYIPVTVGLIAESGKDVAQKTLHLTEATQTFVFENVTGSVVPSVLRGFSAPVKVITPVSDDDLVFRMAHDSDPFNKYEATERLMVNTMQGLLEDVKAGKPLALSQKFVEAYGVNVANAVDGDMGFAARVLAVPALMPHLKSIDPDAVKKVQDFMRDTLAATFAHDFSRIYLATAAPDNETYKVIPEQVGRRELHNLGLAFLSRAMPYAENTVQNQYYKADNMTEKLSALATLVRMEKPSSVDALDNFYQKYKDNNNIVDKWLSLQASAPSDHAVENVKELMEHEAFDVTNPNKVRALVGGFVGGNFTAFHNKDGSGYKFLADTIIDLNEVNPRVGAGLARVFGQFKRYDEERQALMLDQLRRIMATPKLDAGLKEVVGQALAMVTPPKPMTTDFGQVAKPDSANP